MENDISKSYIKYIVPILILIGFTIYFAYDIYTFKKAFTHPDFITYYYSFRQWFSQRLLAGEFPLWNPFWGLGITADAWATIPIDIYTILEIIFGPQYHYFQTLQFALLLLVGFFAFVKLGFKPMVSAAGIILYFMMPWVTFYSFYFMKPHSFIANILLFLFVYQWFKTEKSKYLFFIIWTVIFSMFGTKPEYWFVQSNIYIFYSVITALLFHSDKIMHSIKMFFLAVLSMFIGTLAHLWQLNILSRIISYTGRSFDHSISNLFSYEMYYSLFLSIVESSLLKMIGVGLLFYIGIDGKRRFSRIFLLFGVIAFFSLETWRFHEIVLFIKSPVLIGAILGVFLSLLRSGFLFPLRFIIYIRYYHIIIRILRDQIKTCILFLLIIYYWFNEGNYETIVNIVHSAPIDLKILVSALVWLGCMQFWRNNLARLAYFSILFIFLIREHGQIIMIYLTGLVWIPARDTYVVDFAIAVLAVIGLASLDRFIIFHSEKRWWRLVSPLSLISIGIIIYSASSNFYYSHWFMEKSPPDYPYYTGVPKLREVVHELRDSRTTRIYILRHDPLSHTYGFGDALMEGVSQVTLYASTITKRYRDWAIYRELGIKPEDKWGGFPSGFTQKTISRLPKINTLGYQWYARYYYTVLTRPPVEKSTLRLLGIKYIVRIFPKSGEMVYTLDPMTWRPKDVQAIEAFIDNLATDLNLKDVHIRKIKQFIYRDIEGLLLTARLNDPLPRAFLVSGITEQSVGEFMDEMSASISDEDDIIKTKSFEFPFKRSARIERYEPEKVSVVVEAEKDGYLVLSDLYHPFWHARVDGKEVGIIPAFYILRGVKVPAGSHRIDFYLRVPYFKTCIGISLLTILLSIVVFFIIKEHSHRAQHRDKLLVEP